jgi:hypothetical protein
MDNVFKNDKLINEKKKKKKTLFLLKHFFSMFTFRCQIKNVLMIYMKDLWKSMKRMQRRNRIKNNDLKQTHKQDT